jgi:hypothetical protein
VTESGEHEVFDDLADQSAPCPKCGQSLYQGYGLAGGGMGSYSYCMTEGCDYFDKTQDAEDE